MSLIDRFLGRPEASLAVVEPSEAKAVTGPGAFAMTYHTPLHSMSRDPHRLMAEAQGLFHSNMWVSAAERAIGNRLRSAPWHLEDENGETVDDKSPEPYRNVLKLLRRPNENMSHKRLWGLTARHVGLCGNAFWYLDQREALAGTPLSIMYINPARMTPALDEGGNITGWVLDHPENQAVNARTSTYQSRVGTPLTVEEVIHFTLDEPDWGIWGVGVAEAAQRKIELDKLADLHAGGVLASGGRLSGLVSPKAGSVVNDDQWVQFVRDWRSITSDPDAAKRLQIAKMPLDFTQMTATPKDLELQDVSRSGRDDILAGWQVPLSQLGIVSSRGMNSGETQKYEEAAMYQGAVQPRGDAIDETTQIRLLDRYAALGVTVTLVTEWPEFDDEAPLYDNAVKAKSIPLTVDQRLEQVGKDPLDPSIYGELGRSIFIDKSMVALFDPTAVTPVPTAPEPQEPETEPSVSTEDEEGIVKADLRKPLLGLRSKTEATWEPKLRRVVTRVLGEQSKLVNSNLEHATRKKNDLSWWNASREHKRFMAALEPIIVDLAAEVAGETRKKVGKPQAKADSFLERVMDQIRVSVGERITGINLTTRDKIASAIAAGVELGEGPADIGVRIQESAAFDESRAELISRTETMNVYNDAALRSYGELDVQMVEAIDGDTDAECAARNGQRYPIDEALGISDHPNGTLDWIPVKAELAPVEQRMREWGPEIHVHIPEQLTTSITIPTPEVVVNVPEMKAPDVTVNLPEVQAPVVNVPAPIVNVEAPVVNLPEAKATLPQEVIVTSLPKRVHRAVRGADDKINGSIEEDI